MQELHVTEGQSVRAGEPLEGLSRMRALREMDGTDRQKNDALIARGPGRLAQALGLSLDDDGLSLLQGPLTLHRPASTRDKARIECGPRVGITKATDLPYRFYESDSPWVSVFRPGKKSQAGVRKK